MKPELWMLMTVLITLNLVDTRAADLVHNAAIELAPPMEEIVSRMLAHSQWQDRTLRAYDATRRFRAANPRFKSEGSNEVRTIFRQPDYHDSKVIQQQGSQFIQERVFAKILEAEKSQENSESDVIPTNYLFAFTGITNCDGRKCYQLSISPKRRSKYLLTGFVWVDAEDYGTDTGSQLETALFLDTSH